MLLVPEIKDTDRAVGGDGGEDPRTAPGDVIDLLVVGDELGVDGLALDVPDGAGGVDGGGADAARVGVVPVEGGERAAVVAVAVAVELAAELDARLRGAVAADGAGVVGGGGVAVGVVGGGDAPDADVVELAA